MRCHNCGQGNPSEARFCVSCGAALVAPVQEPVVPTEYAGFWIRLAAAVVDFFIVTFMALFLFIAALPFIPSGPEWDNSELLFPLSILLFLPLYHWLFTGLKGQTPGKMLFHIRVVNEQGGVPGLKRAALRELLGKLLFAITLFTLFGSRSSDATQMPDWHDKVAGTYVVMVRAKR